MTNRNKVSLKGLIFLIISIHRCMINQGSEASFDMLTLWKVEYWVFEYNTLILVMTLNVTLVFEYNTLIGVYQ